MRIIQRNKYRIPAITTSLDTLLKEVSLQDEEEDDDDDDEEIEEKKEKLNDESSVISQMNETSQSNLIPLTPSPQSTTEVIIILSLLIRFLMNVVFVAMVQLLLLFHSVLIHILIINIQFMNKENERLHPLFPHRTQVIV